MRIGFITQWYDPEVGAAAVSGSIARTLTHRGHDVRVLTGFPNYPSGRIHPGYRVRPYQKEMHGDIAVHRSPLYISHDKDAFRRSLNYLSFAGSSTAIGAATLRSVDVALVYSGPITAALPAVALRLASRVPFVLWAQDMWPESVLASDFLPHSTTSVAEAALHRLCDLVYQQAAAIAVTSPGMADLVAVRGVPDSKIFFVPNWADESQFHQMAQTPESAIEFGPFRPFTVMYAGSLGEIQGLETIVRAADLLRERTDIGFVFVGGGVAEPALRAEVTARRLDSVRFLGVQPAERMSEILALGDVHVVSLKDVPVFRRTLPSKVQTLLAAGRPILGSITGDAATIIEAAGGLTVAPGSAAELAAAIDHMSRMQKRDLERLGRLGNEYYHSALGRRVGGDRLESVLEMACGGRS